MQEIHTNTYRSKFSQIAIFENFAAINFIREFAARTHCMPRVENFIEIL